ncbi:hypothetical protein K523DRAFT_421836, partial [Schizophyllum commune Tattone D]
DHHELHPSTARGGLRAPRRPPLPLSCYAAPYTRVPSLVDRWERARHAWDTDSACVPTDCFTDRAPDPLGDARAAFKGLENVVALSTSSLHIPSRPNPTSDKPGHFLWF